MPQSPKSRAIPDEFFPMVEQGMLNMALKGVRIITEKGDVSRSLIDQAERINGAYEKALTALRAKRSLQSVADKKSRTAPIKGYKPGPPKMKPAENVVKP